MVIEARGQHGPHWAADLVPSTRSSSVVLKVGSQSSGTSSSWELLEKPILSAPAPDLRQQKRPGWGPAICVLTSAPGVLVHTPCLRVLDLRHVLGAPSASAQAAPPAMRTAGRALPSEAREGHSASPGLDQHSTQVAEPRQPAL